MGTAFPVALGRTGSAWGLGLHPVQADGPQKQEGDGRSPPACSRSAARSAMPGAPAPPCPTSRCWKQLLHGRAGLAVLQPHRRCEEGRRRSGQGSTEPMRLDLHNKGDVRYREGFVIAHNPDNQPGKGSCIFAHLWRQPGEATAGCTAMPQENMQRLLDWLRPQARRASCCCRAPSTAPAGAVAAARTGGDVR
jgi:hypothetical protein